MSRCLVWLAQALEPDFSGMPGVAALRIVEDDEVVVAYCCKPEQQG